MLLYLFLATFIVCIVLFIFKPFDLKTIYNNINIGDVFVLKMDEYNPFANSFVKVTNKTEAGGKYWIEYTVDGIHKRSKELKDFLDMYKSKKGE